MNKNELIEQIAVSADITKAKAGLALEALNARGATRRPAKPSRSPLASSRSSALAKSLRMLYNNRLV